MARAGLGDGVHWSRNQGNVEPDGFGQSRRRIRVVGREIAVLRDEQYVVEGNAFLDVEVLHLRIMPKRPPPVKQVHMAKQSSEMPI